MIEKNQPKIKDFGIRKHRKLRIGFAAAIFWATISTTACGPLNTASEDGSGTKGQQSSLPAPCAGAALALSPAGCAIDPTAPLRPPAGPVPTAEPLTPPAGPIPTAEPITPAPEQPDSQSPHPVSVPSELLGTWQGGKANSFYYTFDSQGQYSLEHARSGWGEHGTFSVNGQSITFSPASGNARTSNWEIQEQEPSLDLYGYSFTTLFIDGYSYVK